MSPQVGDVLIATLGGSVISAFLDVYSMYFYRHTTGYGEQPGQPGAITSRA